MSAGQPRTPDGRYWFTNRAKGWYQYTTRSGEVRNFYHNNQEQMASGFAVLAMAAHGNTYEGAGGNPFERIHMTSTDDGEMHMYAASENGAFGVINHSQEGPSEEFSCIRGHEYLPVSEKLPDDATSFGGRMAKDTDRQVYGRPSIDAKANEKANRRAFDDENARIYRIDPHDLAEAQVEARHAYEKMGLSNGEARQAPVYVYMNKNGDPHVEPVYHMGADGQLLKRKSPNTHGGSRAVMLDGDDVTRMSRAMEREGLDDVEVTVSRGTTARRNALHFRSDYENRTTHDSVTMWGSVEAKNSGTAYIPAAAARQPNDEAAVKRLGVRDKAAQRFHNPQNVEDATRLLRLKDTTRAEPRYIRKEDVSITSSGDIHLADGTGDTDTVYDGTGRRIGSYAHTVRGFANVYNASRTPEMRLNDEQITRMDDGYFKVGREVRGENNTVEYKTTYYRPDGHALSARIVERRYGEQQVPEE